MLFLLSEILGSNTSTNIYQPIPKKKFYFTCTILPTTCLLFGLKCAEYTFFSSVVTYMYNVYYIIQYIIN